MKKTGIMLLAACILVLGVVSWGYVIRKNADSNQQETLADSADSQDDAATKLVSLTGTAIENGMIEAAQNKALSLYIHPGTTEIAVLDRASNEMWYSNPQDLKSNEKITPLYQSLLASQLKLSYFNEKGQVSTFNSFDDSVSKGQFEIGKVDKGVKVTYTLGTVVKGLDFIPLAISEKRFNEEIIQKIEDEKTKKSIAYKFAFNKEKKVYTPRVMQPFVVEEVAGILESIGYTSEDAAQDNKENGFENISTAKSIQFKVSVVYSLEEDRLVVSVPTNELEYPAKFPILSLNVLEYFGAAGVKDQGYMFVPDGSGALIQLNNGKTAADPYKASVYGEDSAIIQKEKLQSNMPIRMPVFGMVKEGHALMGVIEEADAFASITADVSGRNHTYNYVSPQFNLMVADQISLSSGKDTSAISVFQSRIYEGDLKISYSFLNGESASYSGMAKLYRERLADQYGWEKISADTKLPFVLQVEGAFPRKQSFLGVPYESVETLTKYKEATEISEQLLQEGVSNIHLRYSGWFNGGIRHESPKDIELDSKLGGAREFEKLKKFSDENGITLYPDVAFLKKYKGSSDAAMFLNKKKAKVFEYHPVYYSEDKSRFLNYVLSPLALESTVNAFSKKYKDLGVTGLSLRDLAADLSSDFTIEGMVDRQQSRNLAEQQTEKLGSSVDQIMVSGGNMYAASYADIVVEAPLQSSRYLIIDQDVPFYSMVLNGYIDTAGQPWNMNMESGRQKLLKALETGSSVYYDWFYAEPSVVKDTKYDYLFSGYYKDWLNEASALYEEANGVLQSVRGQTILSHEKLAEEVYQTTYENGFKIIVNYGNQAAAIDGIQIDAEGYWAGGG